MKTYLVGGAVRDVFMGKVPKDYDFVVTGATEADFAHHQYHVQQAIEKQYDPEYVDDCYYYEELVCEFE
jgi:tRNA nucleotidyltransferase/poly(A) polymerase